MSAEDHYLDAIAALDEGDRDTALNAARKVVTLDNEHVDSWWMIADLELPHDSAPNLKQASRALAACRKVIAIAPDRVDAWVRGGRILADELGMYEEALAWWQGCREQAPFEAVPVIEQTAILADLGMYDLAMDRLNGILEDNLDLGTQQYARIARLHAIVRKASVQEKSQHFKPWKINHPGWNALTLRADKPPVSENLIFMLSTVPFLMIEVFISRQLFGEGWQGFCLTSLLILTTVAFGMRFSRKIFQSINRPAFNLLRAMDVESSSGYVMIPSEIRTKKLFMFLLSKRPIAYQERLNSIIKQGKKLPLNWQPSIPDLDSHLDEIGTIEDEDGQRELSSYEEE
jgi:tetratricopeptide (TPR) repeat protein